jgi:hypothetical protein
MRVSGVTQGIKDQGQHSEGRHDSEENGSGAERLTRGDVKAGSGGGTYSDGEGLLHGFVVRACPGGGPGSEESCEFGRHL